MEKVDPEVKHFLFSCIDSVEQLEVLLLLYHDPGKSWSAEEISRELRGSSASAANRLRSLQKLGLAEDSQGRYRFSTLDPTLLGILGRLSELYKTQRHGVLALIFSPLKRARDFANGFKWKKDEGSEDG